MTPRWASKLEAQRIPDQSPFASINSVRAQTTALGGAALAGMFVSRAMIEAAFALRLPVPMALVIVCAVIALMSWGCWFLSRRGNYLVRGLCIVFVVASLGATVFTFIKASHS